MDAGICNTPVDCREPHCHCKRAVGFPIWHEFRDRRLPGVSASITRTAASSLVRLSGTSRAVSAVFPLQSGVRSWFIQAEEEIASLVPYIRVPSVRFLASRRATASPSSKHAPKMLPGGRISAKVDLFTSGSFAIGLQAGFLVIADFARPVWPRRNFNGPDYSIGVAFRRGSDRTNTQGV